MVPTVSISIAALIGISAYIVSSINGKEGIIALSITNIKSSKGCIRVAIFQDEKSFKEEKPYKHITALKNDIEDNSLKVSFSLRPGTYGITVLDDVNNNGKMDYNFIGVPKEGFGFADYFHGGLSRPKFKDFKFIFRENENLNMTAKFRYM